METFHPPRSHIASGENIAPGYGVTHNRRTDTPVRPIHPFAKSSPRHFKWRGKESDGRQTISPARRRLTLFFSRADEWNTKTPPFAKDGVLLMLIRKFNLKIHCNPRRHKRG